MNFRDYRWFRNPRGVHNIGVFRPVYTERFTSTGMGWAKFVAGGDEYADVTPELIANNCMPIIRTFRENMGALKPPEEWYGNYQRYVDAGCYWFELYNEPNLEGEWPQDDNGPVLYVSWDNYEECIRPMNDNWIEWAERVVDIGGYPGFTAMADTPDHRHATVFWLDALLRDLRDRYYNRFQRVIANGLWVATHPYIQNHFYQEPAGGPSHVARPHDQQNWQEGGWHFEYPYDPISQRYDPGRTVFGNTPLTPYGDTNGLVAAGQAFQELLQRYFDAGPVPVIGTEGGIWKIPAPDDDPHLIDTRYPPYDHFSHAQATMAMWKWIVEKGPPWFWGVTLWTEWDYFEQFEITPATELMRQTPPMLMNVADIDTGGGVFVEIVPEDIGEQPEAEPTQATPGPGPAQGIPDLHWLVLAPGLQADWFFQAARRYWQTFRPTVMTGWEMIELLPAGVSLGVTVLARPDTISYMDEQIRDPWPNVVYDPIVANTLEEMAQELERRATYNIRFG
ncbi:MAG: hypothetical protein GYB68_03495 [Chloroflexi bacterium]|nr:hypothetical protein [Chloroflexota bacterium]